MYYIMQNNCVQYNFDSGTPSRGFIRQRKKSILSLEPNIWAKHFKGRKQNDNSIRAYRELSKHTGMADCNLANHLRRCIRRNALCNVQNSGIQ